MEEKVFFVSLSEKLKEIKLYDYVGNNETDMLKDIADQVISCDSIEGSADDYYNLAADLAKLNLNKTACNVLKRGLGVYKGSVDLLAFYLLLGKDIEELSEQLEEYYNILNGIPNRSWTWRGYTFTLEYLISKRLRTINSNEIKDIDDKMDFLIRIYYERFPNTESPYLAEARIHSGTDPEEEKRILEKALSELEFCPECSIRYADLLFDGLSLSDTQVNNDKFKKATEYLKYSKLLKVNRDIDIGYSQYLRGLCLMRLLNSEDDYKDHEKINEIYECFRIAYQDELRLRENYIKIMEKHIKVLEFKSRIIFDRDNYTSQH